MNYLIVYPDELNHYGVKGMKWGIRKALPFVGDNRNSYPQSQQEINKRRANRKAKAKKIAKIGGVLALTALASYGAYKVSRNPQALAKGRDFVNYKILKKQKPLNTQELKKIGVKTFEPATFKPATFDIPKKEVSKVQVPKVDIPKKEVNRVQVPKTEIKTTQVKVSDIPKTSTSVVSQKTQSTPVKDTSKQLKKYYGNLDPVKDDYYDYMNSVLKNFK